MRGTLHCDRAAVQEYADVPVVTRRSALTIMMVDATRIGWPAVARRGDEKPSRARASPLAAHAPGGPQLERDVRAEGRPELQRRLVSLRDTHEQRGHSPVVATVQMQHSIRPVELVHDVRQHPADREAQRLVARLLRRRRERRAPLEDGVHLPRARAIERRRLSLHAIRHWLARRAEASVRVPVVEEAQLLRPRHPVCVLFDRVDRRELWRRGRGRAVAPSHRATATPLRHRGKQVLGGELQPLHEQLLQPRAAGVVEHHELAPVAPRRGVQHHVTLQRALSRRLRIQPREHALRGEDRPLDPRAPRVYEPPRAAPQPRQQQVSAHLLGRVRLLVHIPPPQLAAQLDGLLQPDAREHPRLRAAVQRGRPRLRHASRGAEEMVRRYHVARAGAHEVDLPHPEEVGRLVRLVRAPRDLRRPVVVDGRARAVAEGDLHLK
mmetsp:Transcript_30256/g.69407  ORF Transcript_30256/g.69407 Transcript_30256/m.69407 type:complete len:437 (-) Transcript_30256:136-1446(-)